jgi:hypothetical protein
MGRPPTIYADRRVGRALADLTLAIVTNELRVPCLGDHRWTEPRTRGEVAEAILRCRGCPVLDDCRAYAHLQRPTEVVLGGHWWKAGVPVDGAPRSLPGRT